MFMSSRKKANILAFLTAIIWGTTFAIIKRLQINYTPSEIILYRFIIAYCFLFILKPKRLYLERKTEGVIFILAGFTGICLYYLFESISVSMSMASVVGVLVSIGPIFTAIITICFLKEKKMSKRFTSGLIIALIGIVLVSINGRMVGTNSWIGNVLAILAALMWAIYSIISNKIIERYKNIIVCTRIIIFWGVIFLLIYNISNQNIRFIIPDMIDSICFIYLGIGASALCLLMWNYALRKLGPRRTSVYIYLVPVISILVSAILLGEDITLIMICGTAFTLLGLCLCEIESKKESNKEVIK